MLKPCENNSTCTDTNTTLLGYNCTCLRGFDGEQCQFDQRPCKPNTCWHNGIFLSFFFFSNYSTDDLLFEVYVMKHPIQHLNVYVKMDGVVIIVKQW